MRSPSDGIILQKANHIEAELTISGLRIACMALDPAKREPSVALKRTRYCFAETFGMTRSRKAGLAVVEATTSDWRSRKKGPQPEKKRVPFRKVSLQLTVVHFAKPFARPYVANVPLDSLASGRLYCDVNGAETASQEEKPLCHSGSAARSLYRRRLRGPHAGLSEQLDARSFLPVASHG